MLHSSISISSLLLLTTTTTISSGYYIHDRNSPPTSKQARRPPRLDYVVETREDVEADMFQIKESQNPLLFDPFSLTA